MASYDSPPFIVDSHVHLWDEDAVPNLAWLKPGDRLYGPRTVGDYLDAVNNRSSVSSSSSSSSGAVAGDAASGPATGPRVGYIFVECDRKNDGGADWTHPLEEVAFLRRLVEQEEKDKAAGEDGENGEDGKRATAATRQARCLAIVPWAPVHSGPAVLARYLDQVRDAAGPVAWPRVRGFRYLVQDKPHGTMLTDDFVGALRLLGQRGFAFDLGIDQHRRGRTQLAEARTLVERLHAADVPEAERVVLVINHLAKPDLTVLNPQADRGFALWRDTMFALAKASPRHLYVKLSGLFSEMPAALRDQPPSAFFAATYPWLAVLLAAFGPARLMFGSDWPVCTLRYSDPAPSKSSGSSDEEEEKKDASKNTSAAAAAAAAEPLNAGEVGAWDKWRRIVAYLCYMASLSPDDQAMLWGGTAVQAYGLEKE